MSQLFIIETLQGPVNGFNTVFTTSSDYASGTIVVSINGLAMKKDLDDGWFELGGITVQLKEAPKIGDTVGAYYRPL